MANKFFITGMFRSGTTLLARMLNTHEKIVCASDPYRPFFNFFRYIVSENNNLDKQLNPFDPLGDYFAEDKIDLFNMIQNSNLELEIPDDKERSFLLEKIKSHGEPFSPKIINNLNNIKGKTFKEIYDNLLTYIPKYYGEGKELWEGTKEVWSTEFTAPLANTYPEQRFILVVRDPRAVAASKNVKEDKYPWLFLIRQWRKLAILSWIYDKYSSFKDRVLLLKYEDLVSYPETTSEKICNFLNVEVDDKILNPANFLDGNGEKWLQNTSYKNKKVSFNTNSIDKWKDVLTKEEIKFIEKLCFAEMDILGYEFAETKKIGLEDDLLLNPPMIDNSNLADWIKKYYKDRTKLSYLNEISKEDIRNRLIKAPDEIISKLDKRLLKEYFLSLDFYNEIRGINYKGVK